MKTIKQLLEQKEKLNKRYTSYNYNYKLNMKYIEEKQSIIEDKIETIDRELEKLGYKF